MGNIIYAKPLKVFEVGLTTRKGGSFDFVVVAKNKENARAIAKKYQRHYGYSKMAKLKYSGLNKLPQWQGLPNIEGGY